MAEIALSFRCGGDSLVGVLHVGKNPGRRGVLVVVGGGPQYRVGGHRQLTLWSRHLSDHGFPVLRFDYRGMGDSHGSFRGFEHIDEDIRAALDHFFRLVPQLEEVVLWGECDAASAILFYAHRDARVKGAVLLNPWVRTDAGAARTMLRFYYVHRLLQPSFWAKVLSLRFNPVASAGSALRMVRQARSQNLTGRVDGDAAADPAPSDSSEAGLPLPDRMLAGLKRFQRPLLLVLGGRDLIAREFDLLTGNSPGWRQQLGRATVTRHDLPEGDHTFSSAVQRGQVADWGLAWLRTW
jgi:exosortase A-associated hydrolase 1